MSSFTSKENNKKEFIDLMKSDYSSEVFKLVKECGDAGNLQQARIIHQRMLDGGVVISQDRYLSNLVVEMYGKCGSVENAVSVFDETVGKNSFSWTLMLRAYTRNGYNHEALRLFCTMLLEGQQPDCYTLSTVLAVCATLRAIHVGRCLDHCIIGCRERATNLVLGNCLVSMYSRCGELGTAAELFRQMQERDSVSWNTMITALAQHAKFAQAIQLFWEMLQEGVTPTEKTFLSVIGACTGRKDFKTGRIVQAFASLSRLTGTVHVGNSLINMYGKCGRLEEAESVLESMKERSVSSWNSIITAYAQNGSGRRALEVFKRMDVEPNEITFLGLLTACVLLDDLKQGREVHRWIRERGADAGVVLGNALVSMYGKLEAGSSDAKAAFDKIVDKDVISWNTLMAAYVHSGQAGNALELFRSMDLEGVKPDVNTLTSALDACTVLENLSQGRVVHARLEEKTRAFEDEVVGTALINFYGKCGRLETALHIFSSMRTTDVVAWNAMSAAYAQQGETDKTINLFWRMALEGVDADHTSFVTLISACSHGGLFDDACFYFSALVTDYNIAPGGEHFRCMVDVLGRAGFVVKAEELIQAMPFEGLNSPAWMSLLGASKLQGNVRLGLRAGEKVLSIQPGNPSPYAVLSNILGSQS